MYSIYIEQWPVARPVIWLIQQSIKALDSARDRYILGDQNYLEVLISLRRLQDTDRSLVAKQLRLVTLWVGLAESAGRPLCQDLKCSNS